MSSVCLLLSSGFCAVVLMVSGFGAVQSAVAVLITHSAVVWASRRTAGLNDCINGGEELGETL